MKEGDYVTKIATAELGQKIKVQKTGSLTGLEPRALVLVSNTSLFLPFACDLTLYSAAQSGVFSVTVIDSESEIGEPSSNSVSLTSC